MPPLPRPGDGADGLSPSQRGLMVVAILAAHVAGVWGLLQVPQVREAAPMFVNLIALNLKTSETAAVRFNVMSTIADGGGGHDEFYLSGYSLRNNNGFKLNINNVTNKLYADSLYTGHCIPGLGRKIQLTVTARF